MGATKAGRTTRQVTKAQTVARRLVSRIMSVRMWASVRTNGASDICRSAEAEHGGILFPYGARAHFRPARRRHFGRRLKVYPASKARTAMPTRFRTPNFRWMLAT
ncbi:hypothetical protein GCM10022224_056500 [Nonomuraea antimicrobica]|uniref:Uncharacterized protein n=1 Tax=Nonomuraea antimicrobica TaxID=561173 RepID=A0ABP7CDC8_9ACTN